MEARQEAKPAQSLEFIRGWFERAAANAKADGKHDAAALWTDGLAQLRRLASQRDDLVAELQNISGANPSKWDADMRDQFREWAQSRARAALVKVGAA